ncbi:MAG: heme-dependent oxidative N-demethylase subunit alpha family protein [Verrucomicrobiota bacterium]
MSSQLSDVLPDEDFRFHIGIQQGDPAAFFRPTERHRQLMAQRRYWLGEETDIYCAALPESEPLLAEATRLATAWGTVTEADELTPPGEDNVLERCRALGCVWEPDFLLLKVEGPGALHLLAGCVCFPSWWNLTEKIGKPIEFIHGVVPGLNQTLGRSISGFLSKLRPGISWERANWGLSRSSELNLHPERRMPRLIPPLKLEEVWLRIEDQSLVALPESGGILFGIRLRIVPLGEVKQDEPARRGLVRALRTMPGPVADYKGLAKARGDLIDLLEN